MSTFTTSTEGSTNAGQQQSSGIDSRQQDSILRTSPPARPNDSLSALQRENDSVKKQRLRRENDSLKKQNFILRQETDDLREQKDALEKQMDTLKNHVAKMKLQCWDQI